MYIMFFFRQLRIWLSNRRELKNELNHCSKIPTNLAFVIDEYNPLVEQRLKHTVDFLTEIQQINYIALFVNNGSPTLTFPSNKVQIFTAKQNDSVFLNEMEANRPLDGCHSPFPEPLDLVVIFSKFPKLCNFFTWTLDLATLVFAGPPIDMSPMIVLDAFKTYERSEQRCGK